MKTSDLQFSEYSRALAPFSIYLLVLPSYWQFVPSTSRLSPYYQRPHPFIALVLEQQPVSSSDDSATIAFVFLTSQCPCYTQVFNLSATKLRGFLLSRSVLLNHSCFIKASNPDYNYICPFFFYFEEIKRIPTRVWNPNSCDHSFFSQIKPVRKCFAIFIFFFFWINSFYKQSISDRTILPTSQLI